MTEKNSRLAKSVPLSEVSHLMGVPLKEVSLYIDDCPYAKKIVNAQLRMNCSNLSAHLYSLHVVNSPSCVCSHKAEDTAHYFLDCPLYYTQRMILRNVVTRYTQFDIKILLYGDSGIDHDRNAVIVQAVHDYIRDSERF